MLIRKQVGTSFFVDFFYKIGVVTVDDGTSEPNYLYLTTHPSLVASFQYNRI